MGYVGLIFCSIAMATASLSIFRVFCRYHDKSYCYAVAAEYPERSTVGTYMYIAGKESGYAVLNVITSKMKDLFCIIILHMRYINLVSLKGMYLFKFQIESFEGTGKNFPTCNLD